MRYDTDVYFQKITPGEYDVRTGDYLPDTVAEHRYYANVTDAGTDTMNLVYGHVQQGAKVIRIRGILTADYDYIRIGDKRYRVDMQRTLRMEQTFTVSEVQ